MRNSDTNGRLSGSATLSEGRCRAFFSFVFSDSGRRRKKDLAEIKKGATFAVGKMAEWSIAAVLKTVELRGSGGSNPSLSAELRMRRLNVSVVFFCERFFRQRVVSAPVHKKSVLRTPHSPCGIGYSHITWVAGQEYIDFQWSSGDGFAIRIPISLPKITSEAG